MQKVQGEAVVPSCGAGLRELLRGFQFLWNHLEACAAGLGTPKEPRLNEKWTPITLFSCINAHLDFSSQVGKRVQTLCHNLQTCNHLPLPIHLTPASFGFSHFEHLSVPQPAQPILISGPRYLLFPLSLIRLGAPPSDSDVTPTKWSSLITLLSGILVSPESPPASVLPSSVVSSEH